MTGVVIPLAILIGFCEECAFRGLLPLFIAAKTGLPTAAVVALSGVIFGVSARAVSLGVVVVVLIAVAFYHHRACHAQHVWFHRNNSEFPLQGDGSDGICVMGMGVFFVHYGNIPKPNEKPSLSW